MTLVRSKTGGNFRHSVIMPSKGLRNNPGENNCFMNSAVQVLWHLDVFRRSFRLLAGHTCPGECCIFCALKEIFERFQESDEAALPPDVLRIAMAKAFQDERKFQIGRMGDAAECFENILRRLHYHIAYGQHEDLCNAKHCIPHQKFAMQIREQIFCKCGATSDPLSFFQVVNYVAASALVNEASRPRQNGYRPVSSFGELLKVTSSLGESRPCPDEKKCSYKEKSIIPTKMQRTLLNCPDIVVIGINWHTDQPPAEYVMGLLDCLGKRLELKDLFDNVEDKARKMKLRLVGMMTYYGRHYTTFFYNSRQETWFYLDDARVKEIGPNWDTVKDRCMRGRYQPLLVFYANQDGEPIKASKAPRETTVVSKDDLLSAQNNDSARGKDADKAKSPKQKGAKKDKVSVSEERDAPAKRKSFKKMMGSALKRSKSGKSTSSPRRPNAYNGDHVLSVNGYGVQQNKENLDQSLNDELIKENHHAEEDAERRKRRSVDNTNERMSRDALRPGSDSSTKMGPSKSPVKVNETVPQTHRLQKHQQHVKSIESRLDTTGDVSDYENLESEAAWSKSKARQQGARKSLEMGGRGERTVRNSSEDMDPAGNKRYSIGNSLNSEIQKMHHQPRRFIDQGDAFEDAVDEAESLVISSIAAEQEGNLVESYQLCNEANVRYKTAMDLHGITDKMKEHADKRRVETQNRSRLLSSRIQAFRERSSKSADYDRQMSKTSDYGSWSDASGSPLTPAEYSVFNQKSSKEYQEPNQMYRNGEKGGIQAKLNKERFKQESSKQNHLEPTKSSFFTLPRKKKNHKHKLSSPQPATESEMEQLAALLKNFDSNGNRDRRGSLDSAKKYTTKSVPELDTAYNRRQESDRDSNQSGRIANESSNDGPLKGYPQRTSKDFVLSNSGAISPKVGRSRSEGNALHEPPEVGRGMDKPIRRTDVISSESNHSTKVNSVPLSTDRQQNYAPRKSDEVIFNYSRMPETSRENYQTTRAMFEKADQVNRTDGFAKMKDSSRDDKIPDGKINGKSMAGPEDQKAKAVKPEESPQPEVTLPSQPTNKEQRSAREGSRNQPANETSYNTIVVLESSQKNFDASQNNTKKGSRASDAKPPAKKGDAKEVKTKDSKMDVPSKPTQSLSPRHSEKKRSIFKVVVPKILTTDRLRSVKQPKKSMESREKQYAAMLDAESRGGVDSSRKEAAFDSDINKDSVKDDVALNKTMKKVLHEVQDKHEESLVVDPEVAQNEVAMATKLITQRRLFNDGDRQGISPKTVHSDVSYNDRYYGYKARDEGVSKGSRLEASRLDEKSGVFDQKEIRNVVDESRNVKSEQKMPVSAASTSSFADRFFVGSTESNTSKENMNDFITNNIISKKTERITSPTDYLSDGSSSGCRQGMRVNADQPELIASESAKKLINGPVEPPPRKNPNVYRSSELYRPKPDMTTGQMTRSFPEENERSSGTVQQASPQHHGNTLSRWTNTVDFSKSTRQLCQQCGTVTVEKPRKFCRKCQSDYL